MSLHNVEPTERVTRVAIGAALLSLFLVLEGKARLLGFTGLWPIATAVIGYCPANVLLKRA